jgi:hypothetical protein
MAEQLSKHCWATPKCGISFAEKYFQGVNRPTPYTFLMIRDPYKRMVSFYINKVIYQGDPPWNLKDEYEFEIPIPHFGIKDTSVSFEEFIKTLGTIDVIHAERHLKPQWLGVEGKSFNKIVHMETFKEDIKEVCEVLSFDYEKITERKNNHFVRTDLITEPVYDKPTSWFRVNGMPKDYELYYTAELKDIVYRLYEKDFKLFGYQR